MRDEQYMAMAIRLAEKGRGQVSPNPMAGALLVKNGGIVGSGWHRRAGGAHAEINAINSAGKAAARGAYLYVTLEPCCTYGRTPPCVDAIITAGIKKVICGVSDPNPKHSGKGFEILGKAGIEIKTGVLEEKCRKLNESFFKWIVEGMPFVTLKLAMTLDGRIADFSGASKWITCEKTRKRVQKLRLSSDAILIGGNTLRADKPSLTVRDFRKERQPLRIVASRTMTAAEAEKLFDSAGGEVRALKASSRSEWLNALKKLGKENITSILVEGGGMLASELIDNQLVDKIELHFAPLILGSELAAPAFRGKNRKLADAVKLLNLKLEHSGGDIILSGYPE